MIGFDWINQPDSKLKSLRRDTGVTTLSTTTSTIAKTLSMIAETRSMTEETLSMIRDVVYDSQRHVQKSIVTEFPDLKTSSTVRETFQEEKTTAAEDLKWMKENKSQKCYNAVN